MTAYSRTAGRLQARAGGIAPRSAASRVLPAASAIALALALLPPWGSAPASAADATSPGGSAGGAARPEAAAPVQAADPRITDAERRLFMTDHLANVTVGRTLAYRYERRGTLEPVADDEATVTLQMADGKRTSTVDFLHDDRRLELPPINDVEGNPILLHFLEREIRDFSKTTGGSRNYYRKRIRMALAADPPITPVAIERDGRKLRGFEIRVDPYADDPARSRYERYAMRRYTLVLSPDIPGQIYQLKMEQPPAAGGEPVQTEVLTFQGER